MKRFRAWDKKNRKMTPVLSLWEIWNDGGDIATNNSSYFIDERGRYPGDVSCEDWIFLQASGVRDIEGREIYEGDIIEYAVDGKTYVQECPGLEKWHFWQETEDNPTVNIIGNIYQNPDLLK